MGADLNSLMAANMRSIRLSTGLSQAEMAKKLGYETANAVSSIELGRVPITLDTVERFCEVFELDPSDMFRELEAISKANLRIAQLKKDLQEAESVLYSTDKAYVEKIVKGWDKGGRKREGNTDPVVLDVGDSEGMESGH